MHDNNFYFMIVLCVCWNCTKKKPATLQVTYIHGLFALFFFLSIKEFFQSCTYTLMHINNNYYNTKIIYGNLALEFDEDHYNNSLPVKLAQQHSYVHRLKTNLLKSSISSLEGRDGE